jgi:tRNA threonylcarbamoyladenosine modification (KEOPS) complex Cgi121 subunit
VSKSLAVEVMLYASAQRQIKKAIALIGVKPGSTNVAAVILSRNVDSAKAALHAVSKCIGAEPDESVLELSAEKVERIKRAFGISEVELETAAVAKDAQQALVDVVIERVALLSTQL